MHPAAGEALAAETGANRRHEAWREPTKGKG